MSHCRTHRLQRRYTASKVSSECVSEDKLSDDDAGFPWCAFLFDQKSLDVRYDYARLANSRMRRCHVSDAELTSNADLANSLTIVRHRRPGEAFIAAMKQYVQCSGTQLQAESSRRAVDARMKPVFFDTKLNAMRTVYLNLYQMLQLTAMRYHSYIAAWKPRLETNCMFFMSMSKSLAGMSC